MGNDPLVQDQQFTAFESKALLVFFEYLCQCHDGNSR